MADTTGAQTSSEIATLYGPLLLGSLLALGLSGLVSAQSTIYYKLFEEDSRRIKCMVSVVWALDLLHTIFICSTVWQYFISFYGDATKIDVIPWTLALSVLITAVITFLVQGFFARRIFALSKNRYITASIVILAFLRLTAASGSTVEMIIVKSFKTFSRISPGWIFTTGLVLSSTCDVLIAVSMCYYLRSMREDTVKSSNITEVVDSLMLYTLENGLLTCLITVISTACWLTMPHNSIFLGVYFVIEKLYANSLLAILNSRYQLRERHCHEPSIRTTDFASSYRQREPLHLTGPFTYRQSLKFEIPPIGVLPHHTTRGGGEKRPR